MAVRVIGKDVTLLALQNINVAGSNIGSGYDFLADFDSCRLSLTRNGVDTMATKDDADSKRASHWSGTLTLSGLKQRASSSSHASAFATSAYGVVNFTDEASGDAYQVPVFLAKYDFDASGKAASKYSVDLDLNGVPLLNGTSMTLDV